MQDTALESIKLIPKQIQQAWTEMYDVEIADQYRQAELIAFAGMGGSIYNYHVINSLFKDQIKKPIIKINNYQSPLYYNQQTLFVALSYSGSTEEVVYDLKQAEKRECQCFVLSTGGSVIDYAKEKNVPYYQFKPIHNPSGQPRMGQGYMLFGPIALLNKLGYFQPDVNIQELAELDNLLSKISESAEKLSKQVMNQELFFVASDHLAGNAHILRNQTNETAKLFANYNLIPELNHHLMEGLKNPKSRNKTFIFLESDLYFKRNQTRVELTKEVIEKNKLNMLSYKPQTKTKLAQFVEILIWGGYFTYFLGKAYGEDPNKIPWVDYFKEKLGKMTEL